NRKLKLKNRLVMPPMATAKADSMGLVSPALLQYYNEKSQGGYLGLVITEHAYITPQGKASANQLSSATDETIDGLTKLAQTIQQNGSKAVLQINHAGSATTKGITGADVAGPSAVCNPSKANSVVPLELTQADICNLVQQFAQAANRAKMAGFDGVEIHSCHGYLLDQFLSPLTNRRTDAYGGSIANRIRIHLNVIEAVRLAVGEDFPLLLRMGATDHMEGGLSMEDSVAAAQAFEKAGVDILDVSGGMCRFAIPGINMTECFSQCSKTIKAAVSIPVIVTGGIKEVMEAEALLRDNRADLVGVGSAILNDSSWAKKAMDTMQVK
ncbi:MAG: NADH:flavin oxidoreductase, partial [Lawsonibacter sp.]